MAGLKEIKGVEPKVESLLNKIPETRDSDELLEGLIWWDELDDPENTDLPTFFRLRANGELTSSGSITRARRKLQEKHEKYRGEKYKARHKEEKVVRDGITKL